MRYRHHAGYLLRVVLVIAPLLALWWTLLLDPLLATLRLSSELVFRICMTADPPAQVIIEPGGNWLFRVPVPQAVARRDEIQRLFGRVSLAAPLVKVRSLRLEIPGRDPSLFLVTLPFFWAIVLAAGWTRRTLPALAAGSCLLVLLAVLLLAFTVVRAFVVNTHLQISAFSQALLDAGDMASLNVIPYLAPVVQALLLDSNLRARIFAPQAAPAIAVARQRRGAPRSHRPGPVARRAHSGFR
jgi:hypothetical protein